MLFDSHTHTKFSADSEMKAADALAAARAQGLGLVFTEHMDIDVKPIDFTFDTHAYWQEYEPLRGDGLLLGVELGLENRTLEASRAVIEEVPFDFVLGAIHFLDELDLYYPDFFQGKTKEEAYRRYLKDMAENIYSHPFIDALAHIDYVARYPHYEDTELSYAEFKEEIDAVLAALLETETVIELNTRRLGSRRALKELVPIYARYRELGGKYVTLGSDAHKPEAIGMNFPRALDMLEALDLKLVTFKERKMVLL